jgi:hypothetical protein
MHRVPHPSRVLRECGDFAPDSYEPNHTQGGPVKRRKIAREIVRTKASIGQLRLNP